MKVIILIALIGNIFLHPTKYPNKINITCNDSANTPTIISYHTHILYMLTNPQEIEASMKLRERTIEHFKDYLGVDCEGRYDDGRLCMIIDHPFNITLRNGPFPVGEWSIFVPLPYFSLVIPWLAQNRGQFSLLVHPNTGCEYEDHSIWAFWIGNPWPLDMSIFEKNVQTNEFDRVPGNDMNPSCLKEKLACGSPEFVGPALPCCEGTYCSCNGYDLRNCNCEKLNSHKFPCE